MCLTGCRWYFGEEVAHYIAFLNAVFCWMLPPAIVGLYLWAALPRDGECQGLENVVSRGLADHNVQSQVEHPTSSCFCVVAPVLVGP